MKNENFNISFSTDQPAKEVFRAILDVPGWWSGIYGEDITGNTQNLNDEFVFTAAEGAHYSTQKMIEIVPAEKVVWLVTDSRLTFLKKPGEWTGSRLVFKLDSQGKKTRVTFTHEGLSPVIECYDMCAPAWTRYIRERLIPRIEKEKAE